MPLVNYSSSSDGDSDDENTSEQTSSINPTNTVQNSNSSSLPPLPSKFHDLYASTARVSNTDDPALHGGRKRVTPHIEGNWPTHLYLEWYPSPAEHDALCSLIAALQDTEPIESSLTSKLGVPLPLHVSLSRSIGLSIEQKDELVASLERSIQGSGIRPFNMTFLKLDWTPNFERTRWFLVLRIQKPTANGLNKLLSLCNQVVEDHGQPPLYTKSTTTNDQSEPKRRKTSTAGFKALAQNPNRVVQDVSDAFHISIAWTLKAPSAELVRVTEEVTSMSTFAAIQQMQVKVEDMKAKVGNVVTNIELPRKVVEEKSLFGL